MASETRNVLDLNRAKLNNYFQASRLIFQSQEICKGSGAASRGGESGPYLDEPRCSEGVLIFDFLHLVLD
jgi:hypothetical protein